MRPLRRCSRYYWNSRNAPAFPVLNVNTKTFRLMSDIHGPETLKTKGIAHYLPKFFRAVLSPFSV
jgi:hypothetical protein